MIESIEQLDPTEELTVEIINTKVKTGIAILTIRTIFIQTISFFSNAFLTFFLLPAEYGVFFLVSAVVNFLAYFSDIGFAAALIQKKERLTDDELKTVFTAQQVLVLLLIAFVLISTPLIRGLYHFNQPAIYLLWVLALSLLLSSLKTIPSVLLERKLEFNKLVLPQIIETIVFNLTAVYLAWKGFGVTSFTVAILLRGITGLITMYLVAPWIPAISFSVKSFKSILRFGVPYQANAFLAMIKDDGMTLFLGTILGAQGIGLLGWAQKWAYAPLRFFMDQVIKVTFPAFSRLQDNKEQLSKVVSKSVMFVCILVFPFLTMLVLTAPILIKIIPKYNKWEAALGALVILSITSALSAITTPLTNTLNAIGRISLTFKLMIMWTVLTWVFVPVLTLLYGLNGAAIGLTLVGLSSFIAIYIISKYVNLNYIQIVGKPLIASALMGTVVIIVKNMLTVSFLQVVLMLISGFICYGIVIFFLEESVGIFLKSQFKKR